ncbi:MAG: ArsC family transcriptional regulator [Spirochaetes bacterium]|nr:MAG: ArsC family transcriptional regulator [Spirochaetota bacterium]
MNIQIIGTKKSNNTKKAIRFFKERNIKFHFMDLNERKISEGELSNVLARVSVDDLLDTESQSYKKRGFAYMEFDPIEEILEDNMLMRTPVVRNGKEVTVGNNIEVWKQWLK